MHVHFECLVWWSLRNQASGWRLAREECYFRPKAFLGWHFNKYLHEFKDWAMRKCIPDRTRRKCQDPEVGVGVGVGAEWRGGNFRPRSRQGRHRCIMFCLIGKSLTVVLGMMGCLGRILSRKMTNCVSYYITLQYSLDFGFWDHPRIHYHF